MRIRTVFFVVCALVAALVSPAAQAAVDLSQVNRSVGWVDSPALSRGVIYKQTVDANSSSLNPCDEGWKNCDPANGDTVVVSNVLGSCATAPQGVPCIENVWVKAAGAESWTQGVHSGELVGQGFYDFEARPQWGIGPSQVSNKYVFEGWDSGAGNVINVMPTLDVEITANAAKITPGRLNILASAVTMDEQLGAGYCFSAFTPSNDECWKDVAHPNPYSLKVELRLNTTPKGWATGRLAAPNYLVEEGLTEGPAVRFTIEGSPVLTPIVTQDYWYLDLADRAKWNEMLDVWNIPWKLNGEVISAGPMVTPTSINEFVAAVKIDPELDKADSTAWVWRADVSFDKYEMGECVANSLIGFIGSNSMTYASELPKINTTTYSFDYQIASPHTLPNDTVFTGTYEMRLAKSFANCIWRKELNVTGFSFVDSDTEVAVLAPDGTTKTAITSASVSNGIIAFTATGFTFSKNIIKAKLTKKVKTLTCIKGKSTKKVTNLKPKCPTGYKKAVTITCTKANKTKSVVGLAPRCPAGWRKK